MKEILSNGSMRSIAQAIEEMKAEGAVSKGSPEKKSKITAAVP